MCLDSCVVAELARTQADHICGKTPTLRHDNASAEMGSENIFCLSTPIEAHGKMFSDLLAAISVRSPLLHTSFMW
jgi:hypothetical protein